MDFSLSMEDDKHTLSKLRSALNETMRSITPDFRIGFGSFVDKDVLPFVSISDIRRTCNGTCEPAHGFINHLALQDNIDVFIDKVTNIKMSGSLDNPEGGFDALMQVISCSKDIGWRDNARKIILFATDETSHFAGDGKLAGIIRPNDASCHLNKSGAYIASTQLDYPSISQINFKAKEKSIHIIFAVTMTCYDWYKDLVYYIQGSSAAVLSNDSSNILSLIKEEYEKIIATVDMEDNAVHPIKTVYFAETKEGYIQSNKIEGLKINSTANFVVNISVESCDELINKHMDFGIKPIGISSSFLSIKLELICNCPCSVKGNEGYVENAEECNKQGTLECGICMCYKNYFGHNCECDRPVTNVPCQKNSETTVVCSGRGLCICGKCECDKGINAGDKWQIL